MENHEQSREAKIQVSGLSKVFGHHPEKVLALRDEGKGRSEILEETGQTLGLTNINFDAFEGELLVIMGLSGSGKSTLIRCLNRLIEPSEGTIVINGTDVTSLGRKDLLEFRRKNFSMVFQNFALFPHRTVAENAEFGLEIRKMDKAERREKAYKALAQVGLKGWEESYPGQLSGGMQQRVGLARALANEADILLMDEAFSALDPLIRGDMQQELLELQQQMRKTIIFITHDLDEAINIGDRIVLLKDGAIMQIGTPEEILTNPANDYVARFVEGVNVAKVLTAEHVMRRPRIVARPGDGPRTALHKMNEFDHDSIYVLDADHRLLGLLSSEAAKRAIDDGASDLCPYLSQDFPRASIDTPLQEVFGMFENQSYPVTVLNPEQKVCGVITKGTVLAKLAETGEAV